MSSINSGLSSAGLQSRTLVVAIINDTMAQTHWPGENPVGQQVTRADPNDPYPLWRAAGATTELRQPLLQLTNPQRSSSKTFVFQGQTCSQSTSISSSQQESPPMDRP